MIKFNSDHIIVGQIKQLLATFNLPKYRIYTKANANYYKRYHIECPEIIETVPLDKDNPIPENVRYIDYIKDGLIQRYYNNQWHKTGRAYNYNKKELNHTRNLKIQNNIYDSYTHEYLGDYLRFQRDYNNIDLMPFYNCFSNRLALNLNYYFNIYSSENTTPQIKTVEFNSDDTKYKIFMVPVKIFKEYTIALDCIDGVEICCGIYGKYQDTREKLITLPATTYLKTSSISFASPILYSKLVDSTDMSKISTTELANIEQDLKMFIKIPASNNSTIIILEGNYLHWNDRTIDGNGLEVTEKKLTKNFVHNNFEEDDFHEYIEDRNLNMITSLQLLTLNTTVQYPFSDRLLEFITGNMITQIDTISDNIKRTQTIMQENKNDISIDGLWSQKMQMILYDYINNHYSRNHLTNTDKVDMVGFVDKLVETHYDSIKYENNKPITIHTLKDINLYESTFRNTYNGRKK